MKAIGARTSTSGPPAPQLRCPICDEPLQYRETVLSGVNPPERWHQYECGTCGGF